jgi:hypothetical protein
MAAAEMRAAHAADMHAAGMHPSSHAAMHAATATTASKHW